MPHDDIARYCGAGDRTRRRRVGTLRNQVCRRGLIGRRTTPPIRRSRAGRPSHGNHDRTGPRGTGCELTSRRPAHGRGIGATRGREFRPDRNMAAFGAHRPFRVIGRSHRIANVELVARRGRGRGD